MNASWCQRMVAATCAAGLVVAAPAGATVQGQVGGREQQGLATSVEVLALEEAPLSDTDLDERGSGWWVIIVVVAKGTYKVYKKACTSSTCTKVATQLAKEVGGTIVAKFAGNAAVNAFCKSKWARYGKIGSVSIC